MERRKSAWEIKRSEPFNFENFMLGIDAFPSAFYFQLPNGRESLPSKLGTFFTLLLAVLLGVYGFFELANLVQNDSAGIFSYTI